jgi:hypothetical protein
MGRGSGRGEKDRENERKALLAAVSGFQQYTSSSCLCFSARGSARGVAAAGAAAEPGVGRCAGCAARPLGPAPAHAGRAHHAALYGAGKPSVHFDRHETKAAPARLLAAAPCTMWKEKRGTSAARRGLRCSHRAAQGANMTLAQHLGLVPRPAPLLTEDQVRLTQPQPRPRTPGPGSQHACTAPLPLNTRRSISGSRGVAVSFSHAAALSFHARSSATHP